MLHRVLMLSLTLMSVLANVAFADVDVQFTNNSDWRLSELYLSPTRTNQWGPDQLREKVIESGAAFKLTGIPVGKFDLRIVDEDGDECIVGGVKVAENEDVEIDNDDLVGCQKETAEAEEEEEGEEEEADEG